MPADRKQINREKVEAVIELLKENTAISNQKLDGVKNAEKIGEAEEAKNGN